MTTRADQRENHLGARRGVGDGDGDGDVARPMTTTTALAGVMSSVLEAYLGPSGGELRSSTRGCHRVAS